MQNEKDILSALIAGVVALLRIFRNGDSLSLKVAEVLTCAILGYSGHYAVTGLGFNPDLSVVIACLIGLWGSDIVREIMKNKADKL